MKELVVISGKGGTGKTSVVASFAALAQNAVMADCDVDAADLHLVLKPDVFSINDFSGGSTAKILPEGCTGCGKCLDLCRFDAIKVNKGVYRVDPVACEGCGVCSHFCPEKAIEFGPAINGQWFLSETRHGPMAHAKLGIAQENSGKLVTLVRAQAKKLAQERGHELIIIDGSPGIGCPVIASLTGADLVLAVTEPTMSGRHDLQRVIDLAKHFGVTLIVCINKWDLNEDISGLIEQDAHQQGVTVAGRIRYDRAVTEAQISGLALVEYISSGAAQDMKQLWGNIADLLRQD
ncbi:MAG: (4Fe-4S)-binding protein [Firmicutes bacterium ML8_F2]|nr:MAG: (4Fe-4S)-binding protein [Firmicutes bacterium ML8_F2]